MLNSYGLSISILLVFVLHFFYSLKMALDPDIDCGIYSKNNQVVTHNLFDS